MNKIKYAVLVWLLLTIPLLGTWRYNTDFLSAAVNVNAGATTTNGAEFNSKELNVTGISLVAFTIIFTRAAGSANTVDFSFEASYNGGVNWATYEDVFPKIKTEHSVVSGTTAKVLILVHTRGVSHLRLKSIVNNDGANNLTAINVTLSY